MSDAKLSIRERLEHRVAKFLLALPPGVQLRLAGNAPVVRDGQTLHPEIQLLLAIRKARRLPGLSAFGGSTVMDARAAPLRCEELKNIAPAIVVTAGFDPLRDEGEAYAKMLEGCGTTVVLRRFDSMVHGFANMVGVSRACRGAVGEIATLLRNELSRQQGARS